MIEILKTLKDTPLPSILVIGGILFLLLSFIRKVGSNIELEPEKKWVVGFIGIILLCSGVGLYLIPAMQAPLAITATETPIIESATEAIQPSSNVQPSIIPPTAFIQPIVTLTTQPTVPVPHPTLPLPILCPDYVSRSVVQTWNIGEANVPIVDTKVAEFNTYRTYPRGNFIEGDKIPAGVIVATSFDGAGKSWTEFPVQPLVHRGNYGLFETLGEYIAPYEGACISIAP